MPKEITTFNQAVDAVMQELKELLIAKQHDYGPNNILEFGEFGVLVRLNDKVSRLKHLIMDKLTPKNESIEDTWKDIANYAIIGIMLRRCLFGFPLEKEQ
ncbi:nucleotide modification associated domain-containing protein [Caldanaerobius polysaccharolyticus]|uniref:nucleotide modification associated domain-containing protein n=1 Tax=Caldanaerobius polysaccharolyticus TaxID=44256 RepID=UPI00068C951C|nr:nucleotide modification associated domain-containing protein [Caldanaerobius polysaccharolyticus]